MSIDRWGRNTFQDINTSTLSPQTCVFFLSHTQPCNTKPQFLSLNPSCIYCIKASLYIFSYPHFSLSLSPSSLQAFSATVGQIHTWLQHLQLSRGLAHCHQDEPVQRQLPQLRLYLPAAGGSNDLRVSSLARVQATSFKTHMVLDGHTYIEMTPPRVHVFLAWMHGVTQVFEWLHQTKACMGYAYKYDSLEQKITWCEYFHLWYSIVIIT